MNNLKLSKITYIKELSIEFLLKINNKSKKTTKVIKTGLPSFD